MFRKLIFGRNENLNFIILVDCFFLPIKFILSKEMKHKSIRVYIIKNKIKNIHLPSLLCLLYVFFFKYLFAKKRREKKIKTKNSNRIARTLLFLLKKLNELFVAEDLTMKRKLLFLN